MRTLTILGLVLLISSISFSQEMVIGREFPEKLPLDFFENWVGVDDRPLDYFAYLAQNEEDLDRILRDELTENDRPLERIHSRNPADAKERISVIYGEDTFPYVVFFSQLSEDYKVHDSFMYILDFAENRMRVEGYKKMPKSFYPGRTSSKKKAKRFYKEFGKYIVFMHRNRDEEFLNSEGLEGWLTFGPFESKKEMVAKDPEVARKTPFEKLTFGDFEPAQFTLITRFNHPTGGVEAFVLVGRRHDDDSFTEMLMIHIPNYVDKGESGSPKGVFYKSVKDERWHHIPEKYYESKLSDYLLDKSRLGEYIIFR